MPYFDNPFKNFVVAGAIAMNAAACAPGAGERAGVNTAQDTNMEQSAENSPNAVRDRLLNGMKLGLNDLGDGNYILVAIGSGLSVDGAEKFAMQEIETMKMEADGVVFLPVSGAPKYEKANDGNYYVRVQMRGVSK